MDPRFIAEIRSPHREVERKVRVIAALQNPPLACFFRLGLALSWMPMASGPWAPMRVV